MTLAVHAFLVALERIAGERTETGSATAATRRSFPASPSPPSPPSTCSPRASSVSSSRSASSFFYLAITRQLRLLPKFHLIPSTLVFLAIAAPWHILAALRNPPIALPAGLGLPAHARLGLVLSLQRAHRPLPLPPHPPRLRPGAHPALLAARRHLDLPLGCFLPGAIALHIRELRGAPRPYSPQTSGRPPLPSCSGAGLVLGFFTLSARQEYYSLPALPALALMAGGLLAGADRDHGPASRSGPPQRALAGTTGCWSPRLPGAAVALFFAITAPHTDPHTDIATLLAQGGAYNLSLGHLFDLTGAPWDSSAAR